MKIAIFGYYNALNAGDDRIQYCITRLLKGHQIVFLPHYVLPPRAYLQSFDWILIGGGGLVFERVGIWANTAQWIKHCNAKIGVFGLGVNRVSQDLLADVLALVEHSEFFYVRDALSKSLLNHPKVEIYPDLTWCFPLNREEKWDSGQGVALNLLPCHWQDLDIEAWLKKLSGWPIEPFPFHFGPNRDFDLLEKYFGDRTPQEFTLSPLLKCQLLVACRFHAIVFAMQLRKPFIAINYDDKVYRLLLEADLLECCLQTTEYAQLPEKIQFVVENRFALQQKIDRFAQIQQQQAEDLRQSIQRYLVSSPVSTQQSSMVSLKTTAKKLLGRI